MWPSGQRPKGSVSSVHPVPGVRLAAVTTIPLCVWVQRTLPDRNTRPSLRLPVWKLHRQLSERKAGHEVINESRHTFYFPSVFLWVLLQHFVWNFRLHEKSFSLWPHLLENQHLYRNPLYRRSLECTILRPSTLPLHFKYVQAKTWLNPLCLLITNKHRWV